MERKRRGFTLAELLVVVAIIAVLVAVAIPVFSGAVARAREAVCMANRRSAQGMLATAAMLNEGFADELEDGADWAAVSAALAGAGYSFTDQICPDGGTITLVKEENTLSLACSKHAESSGSEGNKSGIGKALDVMTETTKNFESPDYRTGEDLKYHNEYLDQCGDQIPTVSAEEVLSKFPDGAALYKVAANDTLYWVGMRVFFDGKAQDLLVATTATGKGTVDLKGVLFYYNGAYYHSDQKAYDGSYDAISLNISYSYGQSHTFDEFLADKGWVQAE